MDLSVSLPAFVVAVLLISASPGPAMALILRRTALHGMRTAVPLVLGLELGLYLWALAAAAGFAALVAASEAAYWGLKVVGAGGRPQLRWSLRQDQGLERPWRVPAALNGIRTIPVGEGVTSKRVWIPAPPQRETWRVQFALYGEPADIPDDAADTLTVKDRVDSIPLPPGEGSGDCAL